jgi:hypothetical protein
MTTSLQLARSGPSNNPPPRGVDEREGARLFTNMAANPSPCALALQHTTEFLIIQEH